MEKKEKKRINLLASVSKKKKIEKAANKIISGSKSTLYRIIVQLYLKFIFFLVAGFGQLNCIY